MQTNYSMPRFKLVLAGLLIILPLCIVAAAPMHGAHAQVNNGTNLGGGNNNGTNLGGGTGGTGLTNPLGNVSDLPTLLNAVLTFVTKTIGPVIIILMLVYTGFKFVMAQGKEEQLREARSALMWTVIGAIILLGATVIESVITTTVGAL